jgi:hypothetical protein|tara:strand:+ start:215 stop:334 length:120 start_codon:yes stop_codon:yes gene_type:complete
MSRPIALKKRKYNVGLDVKRLYIWCGLLFIDRDKASRKK